MSDVSARFRRRAGAPPLVFGHRGVRGACAENTFAAFERAASEGAAGIELDVRLCRTGEVVVAHDPTLSRVTGGRDTRAIADIRYEDLCRCDVGGGEPPPCLHEVVSWAMGRGLLVNIELKRDVAQRLRAVRAVAAVLLRFRDADALVASSFDPAMLLALRSLCPRVPVAFLFHNGQRAYRPWRVASVLPVHGAHAEHMLIDDTHVRRFHTRGRFVSAWTINNVRDAQRVAEAGVDAIITDAPALLRAAVG